MKPVKFHPDADAEMTAAARYYESQQRDLGRRFLASVQDAVNRLTINPLLYSVVAEDVRRCPVRTFPYAVLFRALERHTVVVAIMHTHRDPDYWKNRTNTE